MRLPKGLRDILARIPDQPRRRLRRIIVPFYRRYLRNVKFIGVRGSSGKTTTTRLIGAILSEIGACSTGATARNSIPSVIRTVLNTRPDDRFCVQEMASRRPGEMAKLSRIFRSDVGVVLTVGPEHYTNFRGVEATAREKSVLTELLPASGIAILNIDDPHVRDMANRTRARVLTFGLSEDADIRGSGITAAWPNPLSLTVSTGQEVVRIRTQLIGAHWASAVLAATATCRAMDVPLDTCAQVIESVAPIKGRMSSGTTRDGAHFVLDTYKAPYWSVHTVLDFMRAAYADRKVLVFGTFSDTWGSKRPKYENIARQALDIADSVYFVGPNANLARKADPGEGSRRFGMFTTVHGLNAFLQGRLRPGDLVLLKSSGSDHLERVFLDRAGGVACWLERCGRRADCAGCRQRHIAAMPDGFRIEASANQPDMDCEPTAH